MKLMAAVLRLVFVHVAMSAPPTGVHEIVKNEMITYDFPFVSRQQWQARSAKEKEPLNVPVEYVVIHHSLIPSACFDGVRCRRAMRSMQNFHMDEREWWDIGYNFAVGGDGAAYEGRGWKILGGHAKHFNTVSLGICVIGDWTNSLPPAQQVNTVHSLIAAGVEMGYIKPNYKLVGHRQVRETECPGQAFYEDIKTWKHYSPYPSNVKDLIKMKLIKLDEI